MSNTPEKEIEAQSARDSSQNIVENSNLSETDKNLTENHTQNKVDRKKEKEDFPNVVKMPIRLFFCRLLSHIAFGRVKVYYKTLYKSYHIKGKNNIVVITSNGKERILNKNERILETSLHINGNDNFIKIDSSAKFSINLSGNDNIIMIGAVPVALKDTKTFKLSIGIEGNDNTIKTDGALRGTFFLKENNNTISIGKENSFENDASLKIYAFHGNSTCEIGNNNYINQISIQLYNQNSIMIGSHSMFSTGITMFIGDFHTVLKNSTKETLNSKTTVTIGNHVWVGMNVLLLKSAQIPNNCIVGAGSVVAKKFTKENCVIAGNPAKICKEDIDWDGQSLHKYKEENAYWYKQQNAK